MPRRALFISSLALGLVVSTHAQEDPVLRARAQLVSTMVESAEDTVLCGTPCRATNAPVLQSEVGEALCLSGSPMGVAWYWDGQVGKFKVSLRSRSDFDVSVVAKHFGGGGHRQASGFECDELPWRAK